MDRLRVGVINRYTAQKQRHYRLGIALERAGAAFVPIDVRDMNASLGEDGAPRLTVTGAAGQPDLSLDELKLDGVVWRVSEDAFGMYADIQWMIARRYVLVNDWACAQICGNKWRTSVKLADAGIRVVPTALLLPGMKIPAFQSAETVIKPCIGARGRGVRLAEAGAGSGITEPHVAQPLVRSSAEDHVRALVCGFSSVLAMVRRPGERSPSGGVRVNNLEAGGVPAPTSAKPVREAALATAKCLGGDVLGIDLVRWHNEWAVLEVNSSPGLTGIAEVVGADCYGRAAEAVVSRLRRPRVAAQLPLQPADSSIIPKD